MKTKEFLRFTLSAIIIYLTSSTLNLDVAASPPSGSNGTHFHSVIDGQRNKQHSDQFPNHHYARTSVANLNVGEPRTVRLVYLLPNDRVHRAEVVQRMKDEILKVQTFYAEQMEAHGYGRLTFRIETDHQGEPMVHHMDGRYPDASYNATFLPAEVADVFKHIGNVYVTVIDGTRQGAYGGDHSNIKNSGFVVMGGGFTFAVLAHEIGHAFGLSHDFHDDAYIMSYGPGQTRLSACSAEFLSVHPYFNLNSPTEQLTSSKLPVIEATSLRFYPAGAQSLPIRLKVNDRVNDSDGLHQVILSVRTREPHSSVGHWEVKACRRLSGRETTALFDYDGVIPSAVGMSLFDSSIHWIRVEAVNANGDRSETIFPLVEKSPHHIATLEGHTRAVPSVVFSPVDVTLLASGSWDGTVKLWDMATRQNIATLEGHTSQINSVAFSADGTVLASADHTIKLWDVATRRNIATLRGHTRSVVSIVFSPVDATLLASTSLDGTVKLWDVATRRNIATVEGHTNAMDSVSFSSDGVTLAYGSQDGTVKLWDVATRQNIATFEGPRGMTSHAIYPSSVVFSPVDATLLAYVTVDDGIVMLDVATRQNITPFEQPLSEVYSVSFSPDGTVLAAGTGAPAIKLWDLTTGINFATYRQPSVAGSMSFSPDGTVLASGSFSFDAFSGSHDRTVELWDTAIAETGLSPISADVNSDGTVNVLDLVLIAASFGQSGQNDADVNGDGVVNILDLVLVAGMFDGAAAAPSAQPEVPETLTAVEVQDWLTDARSLEAKDPIMKRGVVMLEQLLISLTPKETELLANYPNPFNPETWIPYQLAEEAFVTLTIYDLSGEIIRTLEIGHRIAAAYENRSKAIYWDGKNELGEQVASGVYFYTLTAGDYSATRKMVILK